MKPTALFLTATALLILFSTTVYAQPVDSQVDPRVAQISQRIRDRQFYSSFVKLKPQEFCARFVNDLKAGKNIEFVKPVAKADKFDDPAIAAYTQKCSALELDTEYQECMGPDGVEVTKLPDEKYREYLRKNCSFYKRVGGFRIYDLPAQGGKPADHFVFYATDKAGLFTNGRGIYPDQKTWVGYGRYDVVNTKTCKGVGVMYARDASSYPSADTPPFTLHGVVKYGKDYFLFSLEELSAGSTEKHSPPAYRLHVNSTTGRSASSKNEGGSVCIASTIPAKYKFAIPPSRKP